MVENITNLSDARYCAGMGVDLLGFPIGNREGQIAEGVFKDIAGWVAGPEFVYECPHDMDEDELAKVTQLPSISHVRVGMKQLGKYKSSLLGHSLILNINPNEWAEMSREFPGFTFSYMVLSADDLPDWEKIKATNLPAPLLINYSLVQNENKLNDLPIAGIVLSGSIEEKPGQKDYDHLSSVLELLTYE